MIELIQITLKPRLHLYNWFSLVNYLSFGQMSFHTFVNDDPG